MRSLYIIVAGLLLSLSGCITTASFYCPNPVNAPLLSAKNQSRVDASIGTGAGKYSVAGLTDLSVAWSPEKNIGLIGNFHTFSSGYTDQVNGVATANQIHNNSNLIELGAGYYTTGGEKHRFVADVYGGFGIGKLTTDGFMNRDMKYYRFFLQPGIGFHHKIVDLALNFRFASTTYNYLTPGSGFAISTLNTYEVPPANGHTYFFVEPAFTLRLGYKFAKVQLQLLTSGSGATWERTNTVLSIGMHFSLEYLYMQYYRAHKNA